MVNWKNLDQLASFRELQDTKQVDLARSWQEKAERSAFGSIPYRWQAV
jgi:hypothetical protein